MKITLLLLSLFIFSGIASQTANDSIVLFSDLKFHSEFEKKALHNFVHNKKDTFSLFLAIEENIEHKKAQEYLRVYKSLLDKILAKKLDKKSPEKKIKIVYSSVHSLFLKKYTELEYFSSIFINANYNCVSASMLYALIFDYLNLPYEVKASSNHVYLIANPGKSSIVIETTNPMFENAIFNGEFKRQYVNHLKNSKLISDEEYKNKSVEEIFEQNFLEVKDSEFIHLPGMQYYNKAFEKVQKNNLKDAFPLCQKAYFFYPDYQTKMLLYNVLIAKMQLCSYNKVEDIDLLVQLSRFKDLDPEIFSSLMYEIIEKKLQYLGNDVFCDSIYTRFATQCNNKEILKEVGFVYNLQMFQHKQNSPEGEKYLFNALNYKPNHKIAISQFSYLLRKKVDLIYDTNQLLDTLNVYEEMFQFEFAQSLIQEYKNIAYLRTAAKHYNKGKVTSGQKYLLMFEENCSMPVQNIYLENEIETTYRKIALYYYYKKYKTKMREYINKGLKFVPNSKLLLSMKSY